MKLASYYTSHGRKVHCTLCPHNCVLEHNQYGLCGVRKAANSELFSENYGKMCSMAFDPVEKKPLYHYFPGRTILSAGTMGCNFSCSFCQNFELSQCSPGAALQLRDISASQLIETAGMRSDNIGIAFTYNEPVVGFEFVKETALLARKNHLKTVMVSNGFVNPKPLKELIQFIDAFNIDLKAFSNEFYSNYCTGSLMPVLESLKAIRKAGRHLEICCLIIPGLNDGEKDFRSMVQWIAENLGKDTVLHLNRYSPNFKMTSPPPTSAATLLKLFRIAGEKLQFVYIGNICLETGRNTYCPSCKSLLIGRKAYIAYPCGLGTDGECLKCGMKVVVRT
jgi:pyruvate formate lyase activating enzyme